MQCSIKKILFTFILSLTGMLSVKSQHSYTVSQGISLMIQNALRLKITADTGSERILSKSGFMNGETIIKESVFQIRSNLPWTVTINTGNSFFSTYPKASASLLGVYLKGGTGFLPISNRPTSIMVGGLGNSNFNVNYKPLPGFDFQLQRIYNVSIIYSQQ